MRSFHDMTMIWLLDMKRAGFYDLELYIVSFLASDVLEVSTRNNLIFFHAYAVNIFGDMETRRAFGTQKATTLPKYMPRYLGQMNLSGLQRLLSISISQLHIQEILASSQV